MAKESYDKGIILNTLEQCDWNVRRVAEQLGLSRAMLYKKMERYAIRRPARDS